MISTNVLCICVYINKSTCSTSTHCVRHTPSSLMMMMVVVLMMMILLLLEEKMLEDRISQLFCMSISFGLLSLSLAQLACSQFWRVYSMHVQLEEKCEHENRREREEHYNSSSSFLYLSSTIDLDDDVIVLNIISRHGHASIEYWKEKLFFQSFFLTWSISRDWLRSG